MYNEKGDEGSVVKQVRKKKREGGSTLKRERRRGEKKKEKGFHKGEYNTDKQMIMSLPIHTYIPAQEHHNRTDTQQILMTPSTHTHTITNHRKQRQSLALQFICNSATKLHVVPSWFAIKALSR